MENENSLKESFIPKDADGKPRLYCASDGTFLVTRHSGVFLAKKIETGEERIISALDLETIKELELTPELIKQLGIEI